MTSLEPAAQRDPTADRDRGESGAGESDHPAAPTVGFAMTPGVAAGPPIGLRQLRHGPPGENADAGAAGAGAASAGTASEGTAGAASTLAPSARSLLEQLPPRVAAGVLQRWPGVVGLLARLPPSVQAQLAQALLAATSAGPHAGDEESGEGRGELVAAGGSLIPPARISEVADVLLGRAEPARWMFTVVSLLSQPAAPGRMYRPVAAPLRIAGATPRAPAGELATAEAQRVGRQATKLSAEQRGALSATLGANIERQRFTRSAMGTLPGLHKLVLADKEDIETEDIAAFQRSYDAAMAELTRLHEQGRISLREAQQAEGLVSDVTGSQGQLAAKAAEARRQQAANREAVTAALAELPALKELVELDRADSDAEDIAAFTGPYETAHALLTERSAQQRIGTAEAADSTARLQALKDSQAELHVKAAEVRRNIAANKDAIKGLVTRARPLVTKIYGQTEKGKVPEIEQVQASLGFDRQVVHDRLVALQTALQPHLLPKARPTRDDVAALQTLLNALEERVDEDSTFVDDIKPRTPQEMATSEDPTVVNSRMRITWGNFVTEAKKPSRDLKKCRDKIEEIAAEVDRKTPVTDAALDALIKAEPANKATTQKQLDKQRNSLLTKMGDGDSKRLARKCLEQEAHVSHLLGVLAQADDPQRVPTLLARARVDKTSSEQLATILAKAGKDTGKVSSLFAKVAATHKPLHYFVLGEGGQLPDTLMAALPNVWAGAQCPEPAYQPPGTTFDMIASEAVPKVGTSGPAPGGYAGNRAYGNRGLPPDQLLPTRSVAGGDIAYTEFDIKPWRPHVDRGGERVVRGSDGRRYYTADHYQTFKEIR